MAQTLEAPQMKANVDRQWQLFIDGEMVAGAGTRDLIDPATGKVLCKAPEADKTQVEKAIKAARKAFDHGPWPRMSALERGQGP